MVEIKRQSPVKFSASVRKTEARDNWVVALAYYDEGSGPWLVDLAHKIRWDLQDKSIDGQTIDHHTVPANPGICTLADNTLINRMNRTQVSIYHLGDEAPDMPDFQGYTDVTESTLFLALFGPNIFLLTEKLSNLDLFNPKVEAPLFVQGPFCHVPCQIVILEKAGDGSGGLLLTCSRGYGDSMISAILKAGAGIDLKPAGEIRFNNWMKELQKENNAFRPY